MVVSLAGFAGACYRNTMLMWIYLFVMFFVLAALIGFIIFAYSVTDKGAGRPLLNRAYSDYYLQDYSGWLAERVASNSYWMKIASCVRDSKVCPKMGVTVNGIPETSDMFYRRKLSSIQVPSSSRSFFYYYYYIFSSYRLWLPRHMRLGSNFFDSGVGWAKYLNPESPILKYRLNKMEISVELKDKIKIYNLVGVLPLMKHHNHKKKTDTVGRLSLPREGKGREVFQNLTPNNNDYYFLRNVTYH
ncbi:TET3 [Linum perenne]